MTKLLVPIVLPTFIGVVVLGMAVAKLSNLGEQEKQVALFAAPCATLAFANLAWRFASVLEGKHRKAQIRAGCFFALSGLLVAFFSMNFIDLPNKKLLLDGFLGLAAADWRAAGLVSGIAGLATLAYAFGLFYFGVFEWLGPQEPAKDVKERESMHLEQDKRDSPTTKGDPATAGAH